MEENNKIKLLALVMIIFVPTFEFGHYLEEMYLIILMHICFRYYQYLYV